MAVVSATELYELGKTLEPCERIGRKENFPKEVRGMLKYDSGMVKIFLQNIDIQAMEKAAKRAGFYTVYDKTHLLIYRQKNELPDLPEFVGEEYSPKRLQWYSNNFVTVYPRKKNHKFQHIFGDKIEENLKILDNYFKIKYEEKPEGVSSKISSFFQVKGNPDKV